ncbi:ATP-binding protein [Achromobacter marplatensis]|uniref:ATP-binding protein n=1 Tax=Achromobacter marplatensis TaxID=470868 RepID=UPI0039F6CEF7
MLDTLMLTPTADAVATATAWLSAICQRDGFPPARSITVGLVLEEALTNVLQYSFSSLPADDAAYVRLQLTQEDEKVTLRVTDNGIAFDPTAVQLANRAGDLDSAEPGGHGIRLMRHYTRRMQYRRLGGVNELELVLV